MKYGTSPPRPGCKCGLTGRFGGEVGDGAGVGVGVGCIPLLENMYPIIETSELLDTSHLSNFARRRYEHVRVFERARKAPGGRPAKYDWPSLAEAIKTAGTRFSSEAELVRYCRDNVLLLDSGKPSQDGGPNDKTVREAIATPEFSFFIDKN